ncbi:hypothetical protein GCM10009682_26180 [Luedemannella flava]|uniref:Uncharacterized protein n=1 Tax=Luedemannella flava TaxID=349316 RepID=A0ABP4Y6I9_9ACTN
MTARLDLADPPAEPPASADPLVWRIAYALHVVHRPDSTACCVTCAGSEPWPCRPSRLAARGFEHAVRLRRSPARDHWPINQRPRW